MFCSLGYHTLTSVIFLMIFFISLSVKIMTKCQLFGHLSAVHRYHLADTKLVKVQSLEVTYVHAHAHYSFTAALINMAYTTVKCHCIVACLLVLLNTSATFT